jgi:hypothetical protein
MMIVLDRLDAGFVPILQKMMERTRTDPGRYDAGGN